MALILLQQCLGRHVGECTEAQPRVASAVDGDSKGLGGDVKDIDYGTSEAFN